MLFAGEFPCKLDEKVALRFASLRDYFAVPGSPAIKKAVLVKSQQSAVCGFSRCRTGMRCSMCNGNGLQSTKAELFMHFVVADVVEVEIDRTSRVLIPRKLREENDIDEEVILVGMYDRLEVWSSHVEDPHQPAGGRARAVPQ